MSHGARYHIVHKTKNGPTYRVELLEDGYGGASTRKLAGDDIFTLEYESLSPKDVYARPIQKSNLTLHLLLEDKSDISIVEDLFGAEDDTYRLRLKVDGSTYWEGAVATDLLDYSEGELPSTTRIVAKDLSRLKGQTYTLDGDREKLITVIADILSGLELGLDIKTATSWTEKNISESDDFLNQIYLSELRIRQFAQSDGQDDRPYDKLTVLEMLCKNFGLILRQSDGVWWITQITEQANDPVTIYEYNSSGVQQSSSSVDLDAPVNKADRWLLPGGQNIGYAGIKQVSTTFRHRTKQQVFFFPDEVELTTGDSNIPEAFFISSGEQFIELSFLVTATGEGSESLVTSSLEIRVGDTGNYYYLDNSGEELSWEPSQTDYEFELDDFRPFPNTEPDLEVTVDSGGEWIKRGGVQITTPSIPSNADGTIRVMFRPASGLIEPGTQSLETTTYRDIDFRVSNPTISENNQAVHYSLTQGGDFSEELDLGDTWFGDGPAEHSMSALSYLDGSQILTQSEWRRTGGTAELALQVLLLREILDTQRNYIQGKRTQLLGDYKAHQILTTDSGDDRYFFLSGQLSGRRSMWDAYIVKIDIDTAGDDTIGKFYDEEEGGGGGDGGGPNPEPEEWVAELTSGVSGAVTEISVEVVAGKSIEAGKDYFIWHRAKQAPISFTASEDLEVGKDDLTIEEQRIVAPAGSKIYKEEGQKETERLIQVEQQTATESATASLSLSVKNERQATSLGVTTNQVSGTVTSIALESIPFEVQVEDGDRLTILSTEDADEGNNEEIVVSGDQTLTAGTGTLTINSKALSNTYPAGSAVFEPAAGLTSRITLASQVTTDNSNSIASLETDVSALESTLVLKAEVTSGEITKLAYIQLDASIAGGSAITLAADQIKIDGTTTFTSGYDPTDRADSQDFAGDGSTFSDTPTNFPNTRSDGSPLKAGDLAFDTNYGRKPYRYNGSNWEGAYTVIDGGDIFAGSSVTVGTGNNIAVLSGGSETDSEGNTLRIWAGSSTPADAPFRVTQSGQVTATNFVLFEGGKINITDFEDVTLIGTTTVDTGGKITNAGGDFRVDSNGFTVLTNATWTPTRAYVVEGATSGTAVGGLYGNTGAVFLHGEASNDVVLDAQKINNSGLVRFAHRTITLDSNGLLAVDSSGVGPRTFITVAPNSGTSDTLNGFRILSDGNSPEAGTVLLLQADVGDQITINDGSENINTGIGNVTLGDGGESEVAMFIYSLRHDSWKLINHSV